MLDRVLVQKLLVSLLMILVLAGDSKAGSHSSLSNSLTQQSELDRAEQIEKSVEKLYGENKYDEAIPLAKQALAIRIKILGANNLKVADSLHSLAVLYDAKEITHRLNHYTYKLSK